MVKRMLLQDNTISYSPFSFFGFVCGSRKTVVEIAVLGGWEEYLHEEIGAAAALKEYAERGEDEGEDDFDDVAVVVKSALVMFLIETCEMGKWNDAIARMTVVKRG